METIYIPQLAQAPEKTEAVQIHSHLPGLESLTPVQGWVKVTHRGNYLEVQGQAETIITLTCDRCLQQYNHRLKVDTSELIWLEEPSNAAFEANAAEQEIAFEDLVEALPPNGYFKPGEWLYEQLCLEIPHRQLCEQACPGILTQADHAQSLTDRRWALLEDLKGQISN